MLNRYPLWKYIMLIVILCGALLYALPNIYGENPAVQINGAKGMKVSANTEQTVASILKKHDLTDKSITIENGSVMVNFSNTEVQLKAKDLLEKELGDQYVVALNLAPATPKWLQMLGAQPMKLGLDLRGGVYFLMEVDMHTALDKIQAQTIENFRADLRQSKIPFKGVGKGKETNNVVLNFANSNDESQALDYLRPRYPDYVFATAMNNSLVATMTQASIDETKKNAIAQNINILRSRVNQLGVAEPIVQQQGADRIVVELPGIQDTAQAKEILGATATLEFRLVNTTVDAQAVLNGTQMLPVDSEIKYTRDGEPVVLYKRVVLTGNHINNSTSARDQYGRPVVNISLDSQGGDIMSAVSRNNIHKPMATLFVEYKNSGKKDKNGKPILEKQEEVINVAVIQSQLGSNFQISGIGNPQEAQQLSILLRAGALTAPIQIIQEQTIGPTMGQENITQGMESCFWGLMVSIIFMLVVYRLFGIFASLALLINLVLIVGVMSLLPGATLTMPGIAGIVLTLGVAVDANVLINERIKEELRNGRTVQQAIHEGYAGAWSSIFDANITTLITAIILYVVGTGTVKGYAVTLAIGVATSMFTSIVGTRALVNLIYGGKRVKKLSI